MATISGSTQYLSSHFSYYITWNESDVNNLDNTSKVTASVYIQKIGSYSVESNQNAHDLWIDGTKFSDNNYVDMNPETTPRLLVSGSKTITHNSNGSKSITISSSGEVCHIDPRPSYTPYTGSASGTAVLTNITRASAVTTASATNIDTNSVTMGGNVTDAGIPANTDKGVYWGTTSGSQTNKISYGSGGTGAYTVNLSGLTAGVTYYFKAYTYNTSGYRYGSVLSFTTLSVAPTVTTQVCSNVDFESATGNGNVTATGGTSITRRGFCYMEGTSGDPTTANSVVYDDGTFGTGAFSKAITGLSDATDYRVRAYATNSVGTSYGTTVQLTTQDASSPTVDSVAVSFLSRVKAGIGGDVTNEGGTSVTERGIYWGTTEETQATKVTAGSGTGVYNVLLSGLDEDTTYYFKAFATNEGGTGYGDVLSFKTVKFFPTVGERYALPSFKSS